MEAALEFRRRADECKRMAAITGDSQSKAEWLALAERWSKMAEAASRTRARPARASDASLQPLSTECGAE
jgi:hypothetical protein